MRIPRIRYRSQHIALLIREFPSLPSFRAAARCGDVHFAGGFVDLVDVDDFFNGTMIATLRLPETLLVIEFLGQRFVYVAMAGVVGIAP